MKKLIYPGRLMFAAGITGLGILCFKMKDFIVGRPPAWPATWQINPTLTYISATLLLIAAIAIVFNFRGRMAALTIAALIIVLSLSRHLPKYLNDWVNVYKTLALIGGALIVAASFGGTRAKALILAGSLLLASFFIAGGYAHFKWADGVQYLIPEYIPFRLFWTYFCGVCLFAGGIGLLIPAIRKWAAFLSGIMITGWFLLLHIPRFLADTNNASDRMGLCESFTFAGICFVLAGFLAANAARTD
jgi:uncharacterized membrane protein